mgnify:CR=1 FL=1
MRRALSCAAAMATAVTVLSAAPQERFTSRATGVRVDVLALRGKLPAAGLQVSDFEVRDNGVLQVVDAIEAQDLPVNVVLALDISGSVEGGKLGDLTAAARTLADGLTPRDRMALTTFTQRVRPLVGLTSDLSLVRSALERIRPSGTTALFDGLFVGVAATLAEPGRSLVVACTDGRDTASWLTADEVRDAARRANAVIYVVAAGAAATAGELKDIAETTGGHVIAVRDASAYRDELQRILTEFRSRYVLSFTPTGVPAGGFHTLGVAVKQRGVSVTARRGYFSDR